EASSETPMTKSFVAKESRKIAIDILVRQGRSVDQLWLRDFIKQAARDSIKEREHPTHGFGGNPYDWVATEGILAAACELHSKGKLEMDWEWAVAVLLHKAYRRQSNRSDEILETIHLAHADAFHREVHQLLVSMSNESPIAGSHRIQTVFWNGYWLQSFALGDAKSVWPKALKLFATTSKDKPAAKELLEKVRKTMVTYGADPDHYSKPFQWIDKAIEQLAQK
ncbi:MAG: hypothetical protein AB8B91_05040, partial [Rubripirellula sp.]